jgi:hypothetical protein
MTLSPLLQSSEKGTAVPLLFMENETAAAAVALFTGAEKTYRITGRSLTLNKSLPVVPSTLPLRTIRFGGGGGGVGLLSLFLPQPLREYAAEKTNIKNPKKENLLIIISLL